MDGDEKDGKSDQMLLVLCTAGLVVFDLNVPLRFILRLKCRFLVLMYSGLKGYQFTLIENDVTLYDITCSKRSLA